ncbi:putative nucleotidyltransferase substrate binding domain-containing protein [Ornithinicoccus hortensis]|uniref:CBS domain-containing protein n=1 Tax=Ornithinicoccus hortensis TaxID=82346 RepID=A0A542YP97_9MICO|nr:putative nucleotidyltransferase substrate binding domain-containing protein [Ornithinicoccus hortensis]TQL49916.1 CBS domain-containing protein [Ornithinicoccus hortensis]
MGAEITAVRDFLAGHAPFRDLPPEALSALSRSLTVRYVRRGTRIRSVGEAAHEMFVLRSGAVDITDPEGALVERSDPGTSFGMSALVDPAPSRYDFTAIEDSLLLVVPAEVFARTCAEHAGFATFYAQAHTARLRRALGVLHATTRGGAVFKTSVRDLVRRPPVGTAPSTSIREAARLMADEHVSCLVVLRDGRLVGILTDRDLRTRVLATGRDPADPVSAVMTPDPATVPEDALTFEVLMEMVARAVHHLPVVDRGGRVTGLVTGTDLMRLEHNNPVYLVADIAAAPDQPALTRLSRRIPVILEQLVAEDASADDIGRVVTALGDALERRLLVLAETDLGPPPVPYCWVVLGSQARQEQGLSSDQDNALVLGDDADRADDGYFLELARRVRSGLAACGYAECPGEVMATNSRWRAPVGTWRQHFAGWLDTPQPQAVLNGAIFFDMRPLHGATELVTGLRREVLGRTADSDLFLAYLASHAVGQRPPIGFFRGFALERHGEHRDTLDLKHGGVAAVVDLARVHALRHGIPEVNTRARITEAARAGSLSVGLAAELRDALEFLAYVRLRHQGRAVRAGREPDNFVDPADLTDFDRRHLRDAFRIVRSAQQALSQKMALGHLS